MWPRTDQDVCVRFDDCRPDSQESWKLTGLRSVIEARCPEEVGGALAAVEQGVSDGLWAAGFLAYEAAPGLDPVLAIKTPPAAIGRADLPLVWFGLFERREQVPSLARRPRPTNSEYRLGPWQPSVSQADYATNIERIRERIAAGDTYQVNYTFRLRAPFSGDEFAFYRDLCQAQQAGYCAFISTGPYRVLSASPELFFRIDGDEITTRPMKGTRRRGRWLEEDEDALRALIGSQKERAENVMIVDLMRNDLGRLAIPGSVAVPDLFTAERYENVWQLTSTVRSTLPSGTSMSRVLAATFPSGSVTGAPKVRTMDIIAQLEDSPRGIYTGAIGFLAPHSSKGPRALFNVAIRTVVLDMTEGVAEFGVGGGITYDSTAAGEYEECRAKAAVLTTRRPPFDLLETLRFDPGKGYFLLERHLDRLRRSAVFFGFQCDLSAVRHALDQAVERCVTPQRVRLTVSPAGQALVQVDALPKAVTPIKLAIDDDPIDPDDPLVFHKTTHRGPYQARASRHPEADDVVLVTTRGEVTETTVGNLAVYLGGCWWTPPLTSGCLPGTYRAALLEGHMLRERILYPEDLERAEAIAVVNSVRLWRSAVWLQRSTTGLVGSATATAAKSPKVTASP